MAALHHCTSLGRGPSTPILADELCARLDPLRRMGSSLGRPEGKAAPLRAPSPELGTTGSSPPAEPL